jgi:hypothetical protein
MSTSLWRYQTIPSSTFSTTSMLSTRFTHSSPPDSEPFSTFSPSTFQFMDYWKQKKQEKQKKHAHIITATRHTIRQLQRQWTMTKHTVLGNRLKDLRALSHQLRSHNLSRSWPRSMQSKISSMRHSLPYLLVLCTHFQDPAWQWFAGPDGALSPVPNVRSVVATLYLAYLLGILCKTTQRRPPPCLDTRNGRLPASMVLYAAWIGCLQTGQETKRILIPTALHTKTLTSTIITLLLTTR